MRKLSILSYIFAGLMLSSCDGYLKEDPRDQLYPEDAYDTPQNVYLNTVASLYNYIGGYSDSQGLQGTYRGVYDLNTFTTDEAMLPTRGGDWYDGGFWQGLFLHKWGTNSDAIQATWEYLYKVIVLSNQSLEILGELRQKTDYNDLDRYEAEVRALRAMYYYYLVDMFGRVPLIVSSSMTIFAAAQLAKELGCSWAMSFDGGGSTCMRVGFTNVISSSRLFSTALCACTN